MNYILPAIQMVGESQIHTGQGKVHFGQYHLGQPLGALYSFLHARSSFDMNDHDLVRVEELIIHAIQC